MALHFNIIIVAKHIQPPFKFFLGRLFAIVQYRLRHISANAAGGGNKAFVVLLNQFLVYTRVFAVIAFNKTQRG